MPRILHILSQIPSQTGSGVFFENLLRQCGSSGYHQAAVVGLPAHLKAYPLPGLSVENTREVLFETELLPFRIPGMSDVMPYASTVFSRMDEVAFDSYRNSFKEAVADMIHRFRPDVILSNHLWVATAAACEVIGELEEDITPPRIFAVCHGTDIRQMNLCPFIRPYVTAMCRHIDGVFSLTEHQAEIIAELYGISSERIHVTGTGYDNTVFYRCPTGEGPLHEKTELVYAGKLARSKGLNELIQAMALLDPEAFRLTIAGKGCGAEADEILAAIAAASADIRYVGQLNQKELAGLFRASDIFILPSYYEGLPLVVIESLASEMRVVVNELTGLRDWLGETINGSGRVTYVKMPALKGIDALDPEAGSTYIGALASAIKVAAGTPSLEEDEFKRYYTALEERSWVNVFRRMERLLRA